MALKNVHEVFEDNAVRYHSRIAVEEKDRKITYSDLNKAANILAWTLRTIGVKKETIVNVLLKPGIESVASMIAIFKSGGIYLPMDLSFSQSRLQQIFSQTFSGIIVVSADLKDTVSDLAKELQIELRYLVIFDVDTVTLYKYDNGSLSRVDLREEAAMGRNPNEQIHPDDSNYIFYTSGSTGEGKAIVGCHKGLSHFIHWEIKELGIDKDFKISQIAQITFDASLKDIWPALCAGGTLCIPPPGTKENLSALVRWVEQSEISILQCVPSIFRLILKGLKESKHEGPRFPRLKHVLLAGEMLYAIDVLTWRSLVGDHAEVINLYGTTESTILKTFHRVKEIAPDPSQAIHVGKPIDDTLVAIINDDRICRIGEIGDVYIMSRYMTKGYLNKELNRNVFVQNPLVKDRADIVYKTGDLGRYLSDRSIEILGRKDNQIKFNGIRIETGEIEQAVIGIPDITGVTVVLNKEAGQDDELLCYYTGKSYEHERMRSELAAKLNRDIIPTHFIFLEQFPLNINGKVDRKKLHRPDQLARSVSDVSEPQNDIERKVIEIWKEILKQERISREDAFFNIGGSSLKAIQIIARIHGEFDIVLKIGDIFTNKVYQIAAIIQNSKNDKFEEIVAVPRADHYDLSPAQRGIWILSKFEGQEMSYNIAHAFTVNAGCDFAMLERSIKTLIDRYEILRTTFTLVNGHPKQVVHQPDTHSFVLDYVDLRNVPNQEAAVIDNISEEKQRSFDLEKLFLIRFKILLLTESKFTLVFTTHHIILDFRSIEILLNELFDLYAASKEGSSGSLRPVKIQYKDYVAWLNRQLTGKGLEAHRRFWLSQFQGAIPILHFPTDFPRPLVRTINGSRVNFPLDALTSEGIHKLGAAYEVSLFAILLASVKALLYRYTNQNDIVIGTPLSGRANIELEHQIGLFLNSLPLRTQFDGNDTFEQLLQKVKKTTLNAFEHYIYPFDNLIQDLNLTRDLGRSPLFDWSISLNTSEQSAQASGDTGRLTNKFDKGLDSKLDVSILFMESGGNIVVDINYNRDLFEAATMQLFSERLRLLFECIIADPSVRIDNIPLGAKTRDVAVQQDLEQLINFKF